MTITPQAATGLPELIAALLRGGRELRPAQVEMAALVQRAIAERVPAVLEAATGTGKTQAYLLPALQSGKVTLVSTANKALQEQIFYKDIPFLQQHLRPFGAVLVKGVGNYLCLERLHEARKDLRVQDLYPELPRLVDLVRSDGSFGGDLETLGFTLQPDLRARVNADSDQCAWNRCDWFDSCYVRAMRDRAREAQVIVVNHTLLLLDLAAEGAILPDHDITIIDEAHHLADEATAVFTVTVRPSQVSSLLQLQRVQQHVPGPLLQEVMQRSAQLWARVEQTRFGGSSKVTFREPERLGLQLAAKLVDLAGALRQHRPGQQSEKERVLYDKVITRAQNLADQYNLAFGAFGVKGSSSYVHYAERVTTGRERRPTVQVCAAPLDVSPFLREKLFDRQEIIVLASATLATVGPHPADPQQSGQPNFAFFRKQVGLDVETRTDALEQILPHTFDYSRHALLYVPRDLPEPSYGQSQQAERYTAAIAERMRRLVLASRGRAFLLFSSRRMLDEVYARMGDLPLSLLRQGDLNRAELLARFREESSVLFGLKTFWEGVDIAGEALSLVVIDKLPFGVPDEPVHEARVAQMKANGENWFGGYVLPQVVLQLKQGLGRLLRTREDRGVMAILDTRLYLKGYGRAVLDALPPARRTQALADVERFFAASFQALEKEE